jgi:hypothetical protein
MKKHTDTKLALSKSVILNLSTNVSTGIRTGLIKGDSMYVVPTVCNGPSNGCLPTYHCVR